MRESPQVEPVPRKNGYSGAPPQDRDVSPNSYATYMRSLVRFNHSRINILKDVISKSRVLFMTDMLSMETM